MIVVNSITLGMADPCDFDCSQPSCTALNIAEHTIFVYFAVEMLTKMIAMGVRGRRSYWSEPWNCFDFFILTIDVVEYTFAEQDLNLSAIRCLRVLRPLRAINRISSLRLLVTLILDILPMLGNVMIFCAFIFFVFGIISVQLWAGVLRQRCFFPLHLTEKLGSNSSDSPPDFMPPFYSLPDDDFVCSPVFGMRTCQNIIEYERHDSMCANLFSRDKDKLAACRIWVKNYTDCRADAENPGHGTTNFDNIGYASIAIFQVISLEGWIDVMYYIQDAFSFWAWIYFIILVWLGSYFAVKMCLVVIAAQFSVTKLKDKQERFAKQSSNPLREEGLYLQILDLVSHYFVVLFRKIRRNEGDFMSEKTRKSLNKRKGLCERYTEANRLSIRRILDNEKVQTVVAVLIILNAVVMAMEHHHQGKEITEFIETVNICFTILFLVEMIIRVYALGPTAFIREAFNALDATIVILNLIELLDSNPEASGLSVLRLFRLFRLVKILRFFPALQRQLVLMLNTIDNVASFFILLGFILFVCALLGMTLFGCRFCSSANATQSALQSYSNNSVYVARYFRKCNYSVIRIENYTFDAMDYKSVSNDTKHVPFIMGNMPRLGDEHPQCSEVNFDTLPQSLFTVLQIFTRDNWAAVMRDGIFFTTTWASIYFILLVTVGDYIVFNLLVGILVEGFSAKQENELVRKRLIPLVNEETVPKESSPLLDVKTQRSAMKTFLNEFWNGFGSDRSLFLIRIDNSARRWLQSMLSTTGYDLLSLLFTIASCIVIVVERPNILPGSTERIVLMFLSYFISFVFLLEAIAKIIAHGFLLGKKTYLRHWWNILDFGLLLLAFVDLLLEIFQSQITNKTIVHIMRPVRLLRALRPLRLISRSTGLKVVTKTLGLSIKPIGHVVLICCFFFMIFGILGVQIFKGCFAQCVLPRSIGHLTTLEHASLEHSKNYSQVIALQMVKSKTDCLENGLEWRRESYNFDSLPSALMALFVFATLDGWSDITRSAAKCLGPDLQPSEEGNPWAYFYFISFLFIACFFALNMFVGVVVNNFQKVHTMVEAEMIGEMLQKTSPNAVIRNLINKIWSHCLRQPQERRSSLMSDLSLDGKELNFWIDYPPWRKILYKTIIHKYFDFVVMAAVSVNVILMAIEYHKMPTNLHFAIGIADYVFMVLLTLEMLSKMVALGIRRYLEDRWNQLDLFVTLSSIFGLVMEEIDTVYLPMNPSIVRIARVFRIIRIIRLWRAATNLHRLLDTVSHAIPNVFNLSLLFVLLFFIYASLGVQLYSRFDCHYEKCEGLSRHANFQHFGMALLTLFRIFTGDNWNLILKDVLRLSGDSSHCSDNEEHASSSVEISCGIVYAVSPIYFCSFVLLSQFVLINIVVAVLMQQIESSSKPADRSIETVVFHFQKPPVFNIGQSMPSSSPRPKPQFQLESSKQPLPAALPAISVLKSPCASIDDLWPDVSGFRHSDVISIISTDYVVRQEICDAQYLNEKLKKLERRRRPPHNGHHRARIAVSSTNSMSVSISRGPSLSSLAPSTWSSTASASIPEHDHDSFFSNLTETAIDGESVAYQSSNNLNGPETIDPQIWRELAFEIRTELCRRTGRRDALTNPAHVELCRQQPPSHRTLSTGTAPSCQFTLNWDNESTTPITSPCVSDKLYECASSQFDTWR